MTKDASEIYRYTDLPGLLTILQQSKLTLLDPASWDDKNDSYFLSLYKQAKKLTCLTALCFSDADETYHHWRVFASGSSGIRISFSRPRLYDALSKNRDIRHGKVEYSLITDLEHVPRDISDLPFLKRYPYENENEYRFIHESTTRDQSPVGIDLPLNTIRRVTLSPWMNKTVSDSVKETIWSIPSCGAIDVFRSTLIANDDWKAYGDATLKAFLNAEESRRGRGQDEL
jgi:hypothetical protein